uniref:hypothetical protein n=1 Tax=Prevotella sp. TaxID=59823 RepID=UPI004028CD66
MATSDQGLVSVSELNDGEQMQFYNVDGKLLSRQTAQGDSAALPTHEKMVIVKVGTTNLKVRVNP